MESAEGAGADRQRPSWLVRALVAALRLRYSVPACVLLTTIVAVVGYRSARVAGLPDLGDPFDVAEFRFAQVAEEDNALVDYRAAVDAVAKSPPFLVVTSMFPDPPGSWVNVSPEQRQWLSENQAAIDRWREGTRKSALAVDEIDALDEPDQGSLVYWIAEFGIAAIVQAVRAESEGDAAGAIERALPALRCGSQIAAAGRYPHDLFIRGGAVLVISRCLWSPDVTADQLQATLELLRSDVARTPPHSLYLKVEYIRLLRELEASPESVASWPDAIPAWVPTGMRFFLANQPEQARRGLRQVYWNLLEGVDLPLCERRRLNPLWPETLLSPPRRPGWLSPARLKERIDEAFYSYDPLGLELIASIDEAYQVERAMDQMLLALLAAHLFERRAGRFPASLRELVDAGILAEVPTDRFGGPHDEVGYRQTDDEIVVWSRGRNGTDEDGRNATFDLLVWEPEKSPDIVLRSLRHPPAWAELPDSAFE